MKTFRSLFDEKLNDPAFKTTFERECHVCANTVRIFQTALENGVTHEQLAEKLNVRPDQIQDLADADHCDPPLVARLCKHLDLPAPQNCPRMAREKVAD